MVEQMEWVETVDMTDYIGQSKTAGNNLTLTVYRDGHVIDLKVTLGAKLSI
jgi:S1-C subfamily serine protease